MAAEKWLALPFVLVGLIPLSQVIGKVLRRRRFANHGMRTMGRVIDHVITDKHGHIVVEFEDGQGRRNTFISESRKRLNPVGDLVHIAYLPDEPGDAQASVTAFEFITWALSEIVWGLMFVAAGIVVLIFAGTG